MDIPSSMISQDWLTTIKSFLLSATTQNWVSILLAFVAIIAGIMPYRLQRRQNKDYIKKNKLLLKRDFDIIAEQITNIIKYNIDDKRYSILANKKNLICMKGILDKLTLNYYDFLVLFDKKEDEYYTQLIKELEQLYKLMEQKTMGEGTSLTITTQAQKINELKKQILKSIII